MSQIIWYGAGKNLRDHEKEFVAEISNLYL